LALSRLPVVVAAVPVGHLHVGELDVVEAAHVDARVVSADLGQVPACEAVDPAARAEEALRDLRAPLVRPEARLAGEDAERIRLDDGAEDARLRADRAVAPARRGRVHLDLEADRTAVAAPGVLLRAHDPGSFPSRREAGKHPTG